MGFSHVVKLGGKVTIHCSGQVARDKDYNIVGAGDVAEQASQALALPDFLIEIEATAEIR
jgi:enamine deaminase RidA (YjgF/YER057c/UK114 family)